MNTVPANLRCAKLTGYAPLAVLLALLWSPAKINAQSPQSLDQKFQSAVAQYEAGRYPEAATQLESLLPQAPESFELHELLGLVYSAQSQDAKANPHLQKAVRLKPTDAAAHTNLAASYMRLGKSVQAEFEFGLNGFTETHVAGG